MLGSLLFAALALPPVGSAEAVPLDGPAVTGPLTAITADTVTLAGPDGVEAFPFAALAEVRFPPPADPAPAPDAAVLLRGGSTLPVSAVTLTGGRLAATVPGLGELSLPGAAVRAVRFRPVAGADAERWTELLDANPDGDLAVVRRGDRLDRLAGSVGGIGDEAVPFLLNGSEVDLPRGRANFVGVIFGAVGGAANPAKPTAIVRPHVGGELRASALETADGRLSVTLTDGATLSLPTDGVASIDFAAGSVTPLSELPTRADSDTTAGWADDPWPVGRDRNLEGGPIRVAGRTFDRGLVLHAPATLEWRLPKDSARLRAVAGIEDARRALGVGEVTLTVAGDGRELYAGRLTHADRPVELDLDLTGVRTLTVTVGVGEDPFAGDHLALGNARITQ